MSDRDSHLLSTFNHSGLREEASNKLTFEAKELNLLYNYSLKLNACLWHPVHRQL